MDAYVAFISFYISSINVLCHVQRKSKASTAGKGVAATVSFLDITTACEGCQEVFGLIQLSFWFPGPLRLFGGLVVLHLLYFRMREATGLGNLHRCSKLFLWPSPDVHILNLSLRSGGSSGSRVLLWGLLRGLVSFRFMSDQANSPQTPVKVESHLKTDQETWKEPKAKV